MKSEDLKRRSVSKSFRGGKSNHLSLEENAFIAFIFIALPLLYVL